MFFYEFTETFQTGYSLEHLWTPAFALYDVSSNIKPLRSVFFPIWNWETDRLLAGNN